jgi:hypothetical protein
MPEPGDYGCTPLSDDVGKLIRLGQWLNGNAFAYADAGVHLFSGVWPGYVTPADLAALALA